MDHFCNYCYRTLACLYFPKIGVKETAEAEQTKHARTRSPAQENAVLDSNDLFCICDK